MVIHSTAHVEDGAEIGEGTHIWQLVQVRSQARVGKECTIGRGCFVDSRVVIGNRVKLQNYVSVYEGVTIEDGVFVGPHVTFTNDKLPRAIYPDGTLKPDDALEIEKTHIGYGAAIGANAVLVCGITVGQWAMVGSGAVVTRDVPDYGLVAGNPARLIGYVTPEGNRRDYLPREI